MPASTCVSRRGVVGNEIPIRSVRPDFYNYGNDLNFEKNGKQPVHTRLDLN